MKSMVFAGAFAAALALGACTSERSDTAIRADVQNELTREAFAGPIDVSVVEGVVTLAGNVPNAEAKERAEDIAEDVKGVDQVVNNLRPTMAGDAPLPIVPPGQ